MKNKYTFWKLLGEYDEVKIPIIQRDYAQGRETREVNKIRENFVNDFLINGLLKDEKMELDFVYGTISVEKFNETKEKRIFIPLDGQQRLTTLYLLHVFLGLYDKSERMPEIKEVLSRFKYETRPSTQDFCNSLLDFKPTKDIKHIREEIRDSQWYNPEWENDPTIKGMLTMLHTYSQNEALINSGDDLLGKLLNESEQYISFYFTDLDQFGLSENIYTYECAWKKTY